MLVLGWPPLASRTVGPPREAYAIPGLKRRDGLMLAIPENFLSPQELEEGNLLNVPGVELDKGGCGGLAWDRPPCCPFGRLLQGDLFLPFRSGLRSRAPLRTCSLLAEKPRCLNPDAYPSPEDLLAAANKWVALEQGERIAFYSAQSEEDPPRTLLLSLPSPSQSLPRQSAPPLL